MKHQKASDMDIHFKDGVLRCKYCKKTERTKWPCTLADLLEDGVVAKQLEKFKVAHTYCAWNARGETSLS